MGCGHLLQQDSIVLGASLKKKQAQNETRHHIHTVYNGGKRISELLPEYGGGNNLKMVPNGNISEVALLNMQGLRDWVTSEAVPRLWTWRVFCV